MLAPRVIADRHVAVVSSASPEYTQRKFGNGQSRPESYVFMQGRYFEGITVDRSIEKMSFREIVGFLAPELARAQYFPTKDPKTADLLLVVHWGTTRPRVTTDDVRAKDTATNNPGETPEARYQAALSLGSGAEADLPASNDFLTSYNPAVDEGRMDNLDALTEQIQGGFTMADNARLLGYTKDLRRLSGSLLLSTKEETMRFDLRSERYFIIVKAYDLRVKAEPGQTRRPVWSLYANSSSPGNNFTSALNLMGNASGSFFGRTTDGIVTVQPDVREGKVNLAPLIIIGEVK